MKGWIMKKLEFIKLHEDAALPTKANDTDAGFDITATGVVLDHCGNYVYTTGLSVNIPKGYVGLIFPRSSISKKSLMLTNSVGVIDHGYNGEILFKFKVTAEYGTANFYKPGDRIGQLVLMPLEQFEPEFVTAFNSDFDRGGGFGSTGE